MKPLQKFVASLTDMSLIHHIISNQPNNLPDFPSAALVCTPLVKNPRTGITLRDHMVEESKCCIFFLILLDLNFRPDS